MTNTKPVKIPKGWDHAYSELTNMTDRCRAKHLNDEYTALAREAIAALCRKRPSPTYQRQPPNLGLRCSLRIGTD